ncbi:MAG TPA: hypothetical protein VF756_19485 [Thermoanaerobaculia bacterium]
MSTTKPKQVIQVGSQQIPLPEGVTALDWGLERVNYQNPRIRAFLGCIRLLDGILESNYALLHCSPERLVDIWRKVRQIAELIRNRIGPLLEAPSKLPGMEAARQHAQAALELLERHVLREIDRFPDEVQPEQLLEVRKLLCVCIGQLHAFLQDTFGEIMSKDPRSSHDKDYFLSRRFPKDIEEAEWLHATLLRLRDYLDKLELVRPQHLTQPAAQMRREEALPSRQAWRGTKFFLEILVNGLTPKLKEILPLRGVRFYEMELLDRYATEIPTRCRMAIELHEIGSEAIEGIKGSAQRSREEKEQEVRDLLTSHAVFSRRLAGLIHDVDKLLQDLVAFAPLWLEAVEKRRALLLKKSQEEKGERLPDQEALERFLE